MRPVERGPVPILPNGRNKTVKDYKDWRADLIGRLGPYCSYCNMRLNDSPQVEHVTPKSVVPALLLEWDNMLLACGPCNALKNGHSCDPATHMLPDTHNTQLAFECRQRLHRRQPSSIAAVVGVRAGLSNTQSQKAANTIVLCGLNRVEQTAQQHRRASDLRWLYRFEAAELAARYRSEWDTLPWASLPPGFDSKFISYLRDVVREKGFFSVWFDAFHDVPAVKHMLVDQTTFPNTAACFPAPGYDPVERIPGDL